MMPEPRELLITGDSALLPKGPVSDGAVLARGYSIVAAGERIEIEELASAGAEHLDVAGGTILPGFIDAHAHPISTGLSMLPGQSMRFPAVASIPQLVAAVTDLTVTAPVGEVGARARI